MKFVLGGHPPDCEIFRMGQQLQSGTPGEAPAPEVLKHLAGSLETQWRRHQKKLKRCQRHFSEAAVHHSRVETRRLLSTVELAGAFLSAGATRKARRALKQHLDVFDDLRDTHVQLLYVGRMLRAFPAAKAFHEFLLKRERRFDRRTRKQIRRIKTRRLGKSIQSFREEIGRQRKRIPAKQAFKVVRRAVDRAFARVVRLRERVRAKDTATIHRTRVAFKKFRYMLESLAPLVPGIAGQQLASLHPYQTMMGDIQDVEVLLTTLDKFLRRQEACGERLNAFRNELLRRRQWLIERCLLSADMLRAFWPPADSPCQPRAMNPKPKSS